MLLSSYIIEFPQNGLTLSDLRYSAILGLEAILSLNALRSGISAAAYSAGNCESLTLSPLKTAMSA